jgi:4-hydroxybenzoate polyprenyltransferase
MRSVLQHLRLPFSFFLMPVYWFAYSQSASPNQAKAIWAFVILHFLVYPASNAYNSYFDKDEGSIGGIEKPLPVNIQLYYVANFIDVLAIILAIYFCSYTFAGSILVYILISKAYSHPIIRLKKYPFLSWGIVGFFQGAFVYLAIYQLINESNSDFFEKSALFPALLSSLNLWAFYPITQIYQHEEDAKRGDITMSLKLGIRGTFMFTGILFLFSTVGFHLYFKEPEVLMSNNFIIYLICMVPALVFYNYWVLKSWNKTEFANFKNTMIMNLLGSVCLNLFFIILILNQ